MKKFLFISILSFSIFFNVKSQNTYARFPSISPDGNKIAFSYQGDVWTSTIKGENPDRITIHEAYDSKPIWNADGSKIAFSSNRFGNNDIFTIDSEGGFPQRITWHSTNDLITDWSNTDEIIFESNRNYRQVEWDREFQTVSSTGGTPKRLMNGLGTEATLSKDGKFIAFVRGECRTAREKYQGSANKDIWLYNIKENKYTKITKYEGQDYHPAWSKDNNLYFISARSGKYNIFKVKIDENGNPISTPIQITKENDEIRYFDVSEDNSKIVFEKDINLYSVSTSGGDSKKISFNIKTDYRFDPYEIKTFSNQIDEYEVSPSGKFSAFIIHGELFITENDKKKSLTHNLSKSVFREKDITWLNDSAIIFSSDSKGKFDLYMIQSNDPNQNNLFKTLKYKVKILTKNTEDEHSAVISPDNKKIAFIRGGQFGRIKFIVADIDGKGTIKNEKILIDSWSSPMGISWSPDSKWLAYSLQDLTYNSEIFIQPADNNSKAVNISMHPRGDFSPQWSQDGTKIGFISARNNNNNDIWFAWLKKEDFQKTKEDWDEEIETIEKKDSKEKEKESKDKPKSVIIDFDNIHERLVQVSSFSGNEGNLAISKNGKTFYFSSKSPGSKGRDIFKCKWDGTEIIKVTKSGENPQSVKFDSKGKYLYMNIKGKISRININAPKIEYLPFSAKMKIDFQAELNQVFEEAWRALRDGFYDPEYHGQNWNDLKQKYKPYCMAASTKTDFTFMFNNMLGQLNASHMGLYGRDREKTQKEETGLLGIIAKPEKSGIRIEKVIQNSPANKNTSKLYTNDLITKVNGINIESNINLWSLLINESKNKVLLTVKNKKGIEREVIIRPVSSLRNELYNEWVVERRALVEKYSGGKLGYLHIKGMDMVSFERFERELTAAGYGKEAIVIDVRYNGGGWTTDYLMTVLNVKQHAYTIPRGAVTTLKDNHEFRKFYPFSERLPFFAWNKPSIAICNSASYSNAEIFSHAYKNLKIGTLIGEPTFGAVISTSGQSMIDGSFVRMPFRAWFVKADNKNMETDPAEPDIHISNSVDFKIKGEDEQLKKACEVLLEQISK